MPFLPITREEMKERGIEQFDFVYVIGDAYVDHSSFGPAIISRVLERAGYRVAMLPQPDWRNPSSVLEYGEPRLGFLVTGGNMDSMVNHYSVGRHRRRTDAYTPGGATGKRPDYATVVYCNLIRRSFPKIPILIGGIEASLRRLAHYDYWSDSLKRSILLDSQADFLLYGMGERAIVEVADAMNSGLDIHDITFVNGTVYRTRDCSGVVDAITLPSYDELRADRRRYAESFAVQYRNTDPFSARCLIEPYGREFVVQNPPQPPLSTQEMDDVYALPYQDTYHPSYRKAGGVPAIAEVQFSLVSNRGCFGGCSFCALTFHQGRIVQTRSHDSLLAEAARMTQHPDFKGYIHDAGGPTANFRQPACEKQLTHGACQNRQCLFPTPCRNLRADHTDYVNLLRELRRIEGIKKVFVRSGLRYDYMMADRNDAFFKELVEHHISGQLKVAPEHMSDNALYYMGKPSFNVYEQFRERYARINQKLGRKQYLVPYLMSSHPGATLDDAIMLAQYLNRIGYMPEQVQDFYPTPGTLSTAMYYTGIDPRTMKPVYVAKTPEEKAMQRALLQWRRPDKRPIILAALKKAGREDLIGYGKECLIRPNRSGEQNVAPRSSKPAHRHGVSAARPEKPRRSAKPAAKPASRAPQPKKGWAKPKKKK